MLLKSSSSLAKMILQDRKNSNSKPPDVVDAGSTVWVNNNPKKIGDSREHHKAAPYYEAKFPRILCIYNFKFNHPTKDK